MGVRTDKLRVARGDVSVSDNIDAARFAVLVHRIAVAQLRQKAAYTGAAEIVHEVVAKHAIGVGDTSWPEARYGVQHDAGAFEGRRTEDKNPRLGFVAFLRQPVDELHSARLAIAVHQ